MVVLAIDENDLYWQQGAYWRGLGRFFHRGPRVGLASYLSFLFHWKARRKGRITLCIIVMDVLAIRRSDTLQPKNSTYSSNQAGMLWGQRILPGTIVTQKH